MKLNTPIPQPLPKECDKAANIFRSFVDSGNNGLDGVIPRSVLENAKGFAIFTIFKAGFVFSARAGSGIVIAKLENGSWSAPSAIGTAGLGLGGQLGAEMTDILVVLNNRSAIVSTLEIYRSLSLGGNMSIALGPLGRNGEAYGSVNTKGKVAAMYSYSKTRGLFGGVSIEGSVIVERQDANALAYNSPVTARMLLGGTVEPPSWASNLISTLDGCTGLPGNRKWVSGGLGAADGQYAFGGMASPGAELPSPFRKKKKEATPAFPPASWGSQKDSGSYFDHQETTTSPASSTRPGWDWSPDNSRPTPSRAYTEGPRDTLLKQHRFSQSLSDAPTLGRSGSVFVSSNTERSHRSSRSLAYPVSSNPFSESIAPSSPKPNDDYDPYARDDTVPFLRPKPELARPLQPHEGVARAVALFDFQAVESGDLSFSKGEVITVTKKSGSTDDWWTGKVGDRKGIFPANFVEVV